MPSPVGGRGIPLVQAYFTQKNVQDVLQPLRFQVQDDRTCYRRGAHARFRQHFAGRHVHVPRLLLSLLLHFFLLPFIFRLQPVVRISENVFRRDEPREPNTIRTQVERPVVEVSPLEDVEGMFR
jgi:hypothetical protein